MDLARGAKRSHVAEERLGNLKGARMQRAELTAFERRAVGGAEFVEVAQLRSLDEVLGMSEQIDDRDDPDTSARGGINQFGELLVSIGVAARDRRQAGVFDGVFEMQIEFLVTPVGVTRQEFEQHVESLDLPGKIPLEGTDHQT